MPPSYMKFNKKYKIISTLIAVLYEGLFKILKIENIWASVTNSSKAINQ